ncbi:MAG: DUF3784 domain-containing protein [Peptostreptococcaceae bacterium]|nr:DUF3784 domain-containing protein [Peptostreptococcaceae bacterium]
MMYFLIGGLCGILSLLQFMEKGIVLNKKYFYATEEERKVIDKKVYYRQAAIEWLLFGSYFILTGSSFQFQIGWLRILAWIALGVVIVYSVRSTYQIRNKAKK